MVGEVDWDSSCVEALEADAGDAKGRRAVTCFLSVQLCNDDRKVDLLTR